MTKEQEAQVLANLYDRLHDAVTYSPDGKSSAFDPKSTYIQMTQNMVLNPADFANMMSPVNPKGDLNTAELFSAMVDAIPNGSPQFTPSGRKVSSTYTTIVDGANTSHVTDPNQQKIYDEAYNYLNVTSSVTGFDGTVTTTTNPTAIAQAYDDAEGAYVTAVGGYRAAYNGYDLSKISDQRAWQAVAPGLQLNVDQTWSKWERSGKVEVEQAEDALASTINDALKEVIADSQKLVAPGYQFASSTGAGATWLPSYGVPTNWYSPKLKGVSFSLSSANLNKSASSSATSYAASVSVGWCLWSASACVSGSTSSTKAHMDADSLKIETELMFVTINRPWFNALLFKMHGWTISGEGPGWVSNGDGNHPDGAMALVPVGFVIARNTVITANFSTEDKTTHDSMVSANASGGWGPFSVSGSYSHSTHHETFASTMSGGQIKFQGLQVIAFISSVMPKSPLA